MTNNLPNKIVAGMLNNDPFSQWLGIEVVKIGVGTVTISMTVTNDMLNGFAIAHGGIAYSLADTALAFAANTQGRYAVTIETTILHTGKVVFGDKLTAIAVEKSLLNKVGNYEVTVSKDNGEVIAFLKGMVHRRKKEWNFK